MTIPLTLENARPGMRVRAMKSSGPFLAEEEFIVESVDRNDNNIVVNNARLGPRFLLTGDRFAIADPPAPALTPELLAALREWYRVYNTTDDEAGFYRARLDLDDAIERAGILAPEPAPPPGVTDVQATLPKEWWI